MSLNMDIVNETKQAFDAFKAANDERLKSIEQKFEDPLFDEKLNRINAAIDDLTDKGREAHARLEKIETAVDERPGKEACAAAEYKTAFRAYMRKGDESGIQAAATVGVDPEGGYLVPEETESSIGRIASNVFVMRSLATVRSISSASYKKMVGVGGTTSGWVSEKESRSERSTPALKEINIPAHEIYAEPWATQMLIDDASVDIEAWLADEVAIEFGEQEAAAFITGTGVGQPRGILGYSPVLNTDYAWGNPGYVKSGQASTLAADLDPFITQIYALKQKYRSNATWIMNRATVGECRKLKDSNGNYVWQASNIAGQPAFLLGYPIADDDNMPDVAADAYPIAFGDFRAAYMIVDRIGVRVIRDPYTTKPYVKFYTTKRVGGAVQSFEAYKLQKIEA